MVKAVIGVSELAKLGETIYLAFETAQGGEPGLSEESPWCLGYDSRRTSAEITTFREGWMARARQLADELALPYTVDVASDPFFGRVGQVMAVSQLQQVLKFELLIPYHAAAKPTACMSFNYHREHFGQVWGLQDSRNELAHTGCVAFGMDRLVVALFAHHGLAVAHCPASARRALEL